MPEVFHALGLHLHQPLGNLVSLHNSTEPWEAKQILWCYDRIADARSVLGRGALAPEFPARSSNNSKTRHSRNLFRHRQHRRLHAPLPVREHRIRRQRFVSSGLSADACCGLGRADGLVERSRSLRNSVAITSTVSGRRRWVSAWK